MQMRKKMLKSEYVTLIQEHFAAINQKMTNLDKSTLPRLKEIVEEYSIECDEELIIVTTEALKMQQKLKKARENKKIADDIKNEEEEERSKLLLLQLDM